MAKNQLSAAPPFAVESAVARLGADLRTARLRRNQTIAEVAEAIGTGPRAVMDAERGKPTTGIVVYAALLWNYGLLDQLEAVADATEDEEGLALAGLRERARARPSTGGDDEF